MDEPVAVKVQDQLLIIGPVSYSLRNIARVARIDRPVGFQGTFAHALRRRWFLFVPFVASFWIFVIPLDHLNLGTLFLYLFLFFAFFVGAALSLVALVSAFWSARRGYIRYAVAIEASGMSRDIAVSRDPVQIDSLKRLIEHALQNPGSSQPPTYLNVTNVGTVGYIDNRGGQFGSVSDTSTRRTDVVGKQEGSHVWVAIMTSEAPDERPYETVVNVGSIGSLDNRNGFFGAQTRFTSSAADQPQNEPGERPGRDDAEARSSTDGSSRGSGLGAAEIRELAVVYSSWTPARHLLLRAGLPAERIPDWAGDALTFWRRIDEMISFGSPTDHRASCEPPLTTSPRTTCSRGGAVPDRTSYGPPDPTTGAGPTRRQPT